MTFFDFGIVAAYLIALFAWAIHIGLRETADDFFVFSRRAPLLMVLFSLTSTWVGIGTTVATAASGYQTGISLGVTAVAGAVVGALVAAWLAPRLKAFGDQFEAHTIGDFYHVRYSSSARAVAAIFILVVYVMLTATQLVGLGTLLRVWTGVEYEILVWFAAGSTILYTAFAGLKSDFYTDAVHFVVMVVVLLLILFPLVLLDSQVISGLKYLPKGHLDPLAYGGVSFLVAGLVFGAGSMFVTMEIWQRVYASASASIARTALYASILVIAAFYAVSSFFGLATRVAVPDLADPDQALFVLMIRFLPHGVLGLGIAAFMAVFVSSANSMLMVSSATLTKDFYKGYLARDASGTQMLVAGRLATLVAGAFGVVVALTFPDLVALAVNALFMLLVLVPSVLGGFVWRRGTAAAATTSIVAGSLTLAVLLPKLPETAFVPAFVVALVVFVGMSLATKHAPEEHLEIVRGWYSRAGQGRVSETDEG